MVQTLHSYAELNIDFSLHLTSRVVKIVKTPLKLQWRNLINIITKNSTIDLLFTLHSLRKYFEITYYLGSCRVFLLFIIYYLLSVSTNKHIYYNITLYYKLS